MLFDAVVGVDAVSDVVSVVGWSLATGVYVCRRRDAYFQTPIPIITNSTTTTVAIRAVLFSGSGGGGVSYAIHSKSPAAVFGLGNLPLGHVKGLPSLFTKPCTDSRLPNVTFNPVVSFKSKLRFAAALRPNCTFSSWFRVTACR